jgi:hypothetical protein
MQNSLDNKNKKLKSFRDVPGLEKYNEEVEKKKKRLMWFGVSCIVGVIAVMWIWNIVILIYQTSQNGNALPLISELKQEFTNTN